jgi:hypothetical protein
LPLAAAGARRTPSSATGGGPGFGWGAAARGLQAQRDGGGAQEVRTDFSDLRRRLTGMTQARVDF